MSLSQKTLFITGASRGIGLAIAEKAASEGANIIIAAKTSEPNPKLEGTIHSAAKSIESKGGKALALQVDVRDEASLKNAVDQGAQKFGGIDIVVLNASAIILNKTPEIGSKQFDLMHGVIVRGSYLTVHHSLPYLKKSSSPRILGLCPPMVLEDKWLAPYLPYSLCKFGLSTLIKGWAAEFKNDSIPVNGLWPKTLIATAAVKNLLGGPEAIKKSRQPEIVADAAHWILTQNSTTGQLFYDEDVIRNMGKDPNSYAVDPSQKPLPDIYV